MTICHRIHCIQCLQALYAVKRFQHHEALLPTLERRFTMGNHTGSCGSGCKDSHDHNDHSSRDYWGGPDHPDGYERKGSCFIATAVYGDVMAPEVVSLREFRDSVLKSSLMGRLFIAAYYKVSPPIANWLTTQPRTSRMVRTVLDRIVAAIR